jgi:hypothetical protein
MKKLFFGLLGITMFHLCLLVNKLAWPFKLGLEALVGLSKGLYGVGVWCELKGKEGMRKD